MNPEKKYKATLKFDYKDFRRIYEIIITIDGLPYFKQPEDGSVDFAKRHPPDHQIKKAAAITFKRLIREIFLPWLDRDIDEFIRARRHGDFWRLFMKTKIMPYIEKIESYEIDAEEMENKNGNQEKGK